MKGFKFRGQRILEWRRSVADQARVEFMRASESARETAAAVEAAEQESARAAREFRTVLAGSTDVPTIERYRNWITRQQGVEQASRRAHQERLVIVDRAALVLQGANRQVRIMERLRDRAERRHRDAERQAEMKTIDELATMRYARRQTEQGADRGH